MEKGRIYYTGRYIPDSRVFQEEPAGIYEDQVGEGIAELRVEPLSVITFAPRPAPRRRTRSLIRKAIVLISSIMLPVLFVSLADSLAASPQLFFGSLAVCMGWPAFVVWANYRD